MSAPLTIRVPVALVEDERVGGAPFRVWCALACFASEGEDAPLQADIAHRACIVRRTVTYAIRQLVAAGWLSTTTRGQLVRYTLVTVPSED